MKAAGEHIPAGHQQSGQVDAGQGHQLGGDDLVAGREGHDTVHPLGLDHHFYGGGDDVPAGQDPVHARVTVGQAVAGPDVVEFHRHPARLPNSDLDRLGQGPQVNMPRDELVPGIGHGDEWPVKVPVVEIHGLEQGPSLVIGILRNLPAVQVGMFNFGHRMNSPLQAESPYPAVHPRG